MNAQLIDTYKIYIAAFISVTLNKINFNEVITGILLVLTCVYTVYKIIQIHKEVTNKIRQKKKKEK